MTPPQQSSAALRLLLWGELAVLVHQFFFAPVHTLYFTYLHSPGLASRWFSLWYGLLGLFLTVPVVIGLLRFAAPLDATVRRWAWATVILLGLREALYLGSLALPMPTHGRSAEVVAVISLMGLLAAAVTLATLLTVWKGCLALGARAPRGLFLAIAGLVAVGLVGKQLRLFLADLFPRLSAPVSIVMQGVTLATLGLLTGAILLARAALLRTQDAQPDAAEWKAAAHGLTLWLWGGYTLMGAGVLAIAATALTSMMNPALLIMVLLSLPTVLMAAGLFHYARVPEASGARAPAQAAAGVFVFVYASLPSLLNPDLTRTLRMLEVDALPFLLQAFLRVLGLVGFAFLIQSFRRAAPSEADRTAHLGFVLLVSSGAGLALGLFGEAAGPVRILSFLAALVSAVYAIRFIILVHGLRRGLGQNATAVPGAPPLFSHS